MEKEPKKKSAPEQTGQSGGGLWGIGIYLCLAAVVISLIFASCTGGAVGSVSSSVSLSGADSGTSSTCGSGALVTAGAAVSGSMISVAAGAAVWVASGAGVAVEAV